MHSSVRSGIVAVNPEHYQNDLMGATHPHLIHEKKNIFRTYMIIMIREQIHAS